MEVDTIVSGISELSLESKGMNGTIESDNGEGYECEQSKDDDEGYESSKDDEYMADLEHFYRTVCKKHTAKCHPTTVKGFDHISFRELEALYSIYKSRYGDMPASVFRSRVMFSEGYVWVNKVQQYYWYIHHINMQEIAANMPEEVGELTHLSSLNYSWNELLTVPDTVWNLSLLQSLDLSHNSLTTVPEAISGLVNLRSLYLNHNNIKTVPSALYTLSLLRYIDLSYNPIRSMPRGIHKMKSLVTIRLHHTYMRQYPEGTDKTMKLSAKETLNGDYDSKCISWGYR